jgi:hypothetical protein
MLRSSREEACFLTFFLSYFKNLIIYLFLFLLGFEYRLARQCSITSAIPPAFFALLIFEIGSYFYSLGGLGPGSSYLLCSPHS